jgi:hypothetical protein
VTFLGIKVDLNLGDSDFSDFFHSRIYASGGRQVAEVFSMALIFCKCRMKGKQG